MTVRTAPLAIAVSIACAVSFGSVAQAQSSGGALAPGQRVVEDGLLGQWVLSTDGEVCGVEYIPKGTPDKRFGLSRMVFDPGGPVIMSSITDPADIVPGGEGANLRVRIFRPDGTMVEGTTYSLKQDRLGNFQYLGRVSENWEASVKTAQRIVVLAPDGTQLASHTFPMANNSAPMDALRDCAAGLTPMKRQ